MGMCQIIENGLLKKGKGRLSPSAVLFYAYLLVQEELVAQDDSALYSEWFPFSIKDGLRLSGADAARQTRYLNELKRKKMIRTKRSGLPGKRYVKIVRRSCIG